MIAFASTRPSQGSAESVIAHEKAGEILISVKRRYLEHVQSHGCQESPKRPIF